MAEDGQGDGKPEPDKLTRLAEDAAAAGRRALDNETGRQVADIADAGFTRAGQVVDNLLDSPGGQQLKQGANDLLNKAGPVSQSDAGRNIIAGAAVGFFIGLIFSFIGIFWGTMLGAGLGFLRTITRRS
ncbi:hypothetical protein CHU93_15370 [Sandarakinorhabdus cyanobacteriorum]|uniref:Uncharacterized protein n=1 Tax=Sandarakinorhabdus cyanobacteriorum TaxID=1981098 RepID=A0A255Y7Z1_9SPHN|nr:hypothetical protein [Sandarakinorhabdus cyanobacteriorum]OYQ24735.1 hypothetical protein CHU93_15370 [Sandarakinorhabdus cyanobacteriorum]